MLLIVAAFFAKMVYQLLREPLALGRGRRLTTLFYAAQGVSIAVFLVALVFRIEGVWQASGITLATIFVLSWFVPKPY